MHAGCLVAGYFVAGYIVARYFVAGYFVAGDFVAGIVHWFQPLSLWNSRAYRFTQRSRVY